MTNLLELLALRGFNLDFVQFLIKFDPGAVDKVVDGVIKNDIPSNELTSQYALQEKDNHSFSHKNQESYIASLDSTATGNTLSSGLEHPVYLAFTNDYSGGISKNPLFQPAYDSLVTVVQTPHIQQVMFYVPETSATTLTASSNTQSTDSTADSNANSNFQVFSFNGVLYSFSESELVSFVLPIAMDLNGDGVQYNHLPVLFDANNDGFLDMTQWVDSNDGLLTYDKNHDGKLTDVNEISFVQYQEGARTDLEGLHAFDTNHNNQLDVNDEQWSSFGVTQNNQFLTLDQLNIVSIDLQSDNNLQFLHGGSIEFGQGHFTYSDGSTSKFADVALAYQQVHQEAVLSNSNNSLDTVLENLGLKAASPVESANTAEHQVIALSPAMPELDPIVLVTEVA